MSNIAEFLSELGAGTFEEKISRAITETALAVMANEKQGEIILKLKITPASSSQAKIVHCIETKAPTKYGTRSEKNTTDTLMYVGEKGKMSLFPEDQLQMFTKTGSIKPTQNQE